MRALGRTRAGTRDPVRRTDLDSKAGEACEPKSKGRESGRRESSQGKGSTFLCYRQPVAKLSPKLSFS